MKKIFWKTARISWQIHLVISLIAIVGLASVEIFKVKVKHPMYKQKIQAAQLMKQGMSVIREYKVKHIMPINRAIDPANSGMIGIKGSSITTTRGDYISKRTSIDPNWAAVLIDMFYKARIKRGSTVAVAFSGSFPALNLAVLSAAKILDFNLIIISSAAGSTWGANIPKFPWLKMEQVLNDKQLFSYKTVAASIGGVADKGLDLRIKGLHALRKIINDRKIPLLEADSNKENLSKRMEIYLTHAGDRSIKAFVNVGGGTISVGGSKGKRLFKPGLNIRPKRKALAIDSLLSRFARNQISVIHLSDIKVVAANYDIALAPMRMPMIGEGKLYSYLEYNKYLAGVVLAILISVLYLFIKSDKGSRIFSMTRKKDSSGSAEPMI